MLVRFLVLSALFCLGWSRDINIDSKTEGRKIFDETRQASPAIWRQFENVTIIAPSNELIGKVVVTDMRPEKDGDAQIVDGGEGKKSVTIELKSPTVLRGYEFHIEVYSVPDTVSTDAEEHLSPDDVNITPKDDGETEEPSNVTSENVPNTGAEDIKEDNPRPARETENKNNMETESPEISTSTNSYDMSTATKVDNSITTDQDLTTILPQNLIEDAPASVVTDSDDKIRPARESLINTSTYPLDSVVTESDNIAAENMSNDEATTQFDVTTQAYDEPSTFGPTFVNSKNIPDFDSLSILDYIKSKEAVRPNRGVQDNINGPSSVTTDKSIQTHENIDTTLLSDEVSTLNPTVDDTVDLVPPEVDASYNTGFVNTLETTERTIVTSSLYNIPRSGRGINFDSSIDNVEHQTAVPTATNDANTTENSMNINDEQLRNTRDSKNELEDNAHAGNTNEQIIQNTDVSDKNESGTAYLDAEQPSSNVIILNTKQLVTKGNNKFMYALPIVLLISGDNDIPTIKIVADYSTTVPDTKALPVAPLDESQDRNEYDDKSQESDIDFKPSEDYSQ